MSNTELSSDRIDWIANAHCANGVAYPDAVKRAIKDALREQAALSAQSAGQEPKPVAWIWKYANGEEEVVFVDVATLGLDPELHDVPSKVTPLYTHPPSAAQAEEIRNALEKAAQIVENIEIKRSVKVYKSGSVEYELDNAARMIRALKPPRTKGEGS